MTTPPEPDEIRDEVVPEIPADEVTKDEPDTWDFADSPVVNEVHLSGTDQKEEDGFIVKEILRTGEWPVIPTKNGKVKAPLRVVRDGISDPDEGRISLEELVENFKAGAIERVQIPLSDDRDDHKNITRLNTGFIRDVWIKDEDGQAKLVAKMEITEPDIKEKVLRGTYADVSCGIPWAITRQGKRFGASLEHVAITNRPFIDGLGPFLAASDEAQKTAEVVSFSDVVTPDPAALPEDLTAQDLMTTANTTLAPLGYQVTNFNASSLWFSNSSSVIQSPYTIYTTGTGSYQISLAEPGQWKTEEKETAPTTPKKVVAPRGASSGDDALEAARQVREIRLSDQSTTNREEQRMPLTREELDGLELSDEQRAAFQSVLDEKATLMARVREGEVDSRIEELKGLGLSERPGFLKFYRNIMLADDGGPAVVLSEDGKGKERLSALEILDQALNALKGSDDKVHLSDQALVSGNDEKPPEDASTEKPVDERVSEAREALYGRK